MGHLLLGGGRKGNVGQKPEEDLFKAYGTFKGEP
jgi:hypothetical protein